MPESTAPALSPRGRLTWLLLLGMCIASYFTSFTADIGPHFRADTMVLLVTLVAIAALGWRQFRRDVRA
jgi:hypothetical protein